MTSSPLWGHWLYREILQVIALSLGESSPRSNKQCNLLHTPMPMRACSAVKSFSDRKLKYVTCIVLQRALRLVLLWKVWEWFKQGGKLFVNYFALKTPERTLYFRSWVGATGGKGPDFNIAFPLSWRLFVTLECFTVNIYIPSCLHYLILN